MITQCARVVSVNDNQVRLRVIAPTSCLHCAQGLGCGGGIFNRLRRERTIEFDLHNHLAVKVDDEVTIGVASSTMLKASFIAYFMPLLSVFAFSSFLFYIFETNGSAVFGAVIGIWVGFTLARYSQGLWLRTLQPIMMAKD